jgi:gliding motility-associated-like protein
VTIDQESPDTIWVKVTDQHGCVSYDSVYVAKYNDLIKVPSAITPTRVDGVNDTWVLEGLMFYPDATIVVYDRWGNKVFESRGNEYEPWDGTYNGKYLPMDSYHYVIDLKEEGLPKITGNVTIVR